MTRAWLGAALLSATTAFPLQGQAIQFRVGAQGVFAKHQEFQEGRDADGFGGGGWLGVQVGRVGLDVRGYYASLESDSAGVAPFDVLQGDARLSVLIARPIAVEVGAGGRKIDPEFAAPDVGFFRFGLLARSALTQMADISVRGAYLVPKFNGGGEAGFAFEIGVHASVGTRNGRVRVGGGYEFQRIDREVDALEVPIQLTVARFGVEVRF